MKQEDIDKLDVGDSVYTVYASWHNDIYGGGCHIESGMRSHSIVSFSRFPNKPNYAVLMYSHGTHPADLSSDRFYATHEEAKTAEQEMVKKMREQS